MKNVKVFVASPGDVSEAREQVEVCVGQLKRIPPFSDLSIEVVKWETHTYPAIGPGDAQSIINSQIGSYDLFVGILGARFGSPTDRADSGTEEEFNRAFDSYKENQKPQIMFYFFNKTASIFNLDSSQLQKVLAFRSKLKKLRPGILYKDFHSISEFSTEFLVDLSQQLASLQKSESRSESPEDRPSEEHSGYFDAVMAYAEGFSLMTADLVSLGECISRFSNALPFFSAELERLSQQKTTLDNLVDRQKVFEQLAVALDEMSGGFEETNPRVEAAFKENINHYIQAISLNRDLFPSEEPAIAESIEKFREIRELCINMDGIESLRARIDGFPNFSAVITTSKKRASANLTNFLVLANQMGRHVEEMLNQLQVKRSSGGGFTPESEVRRWRLILEKWVDNAGVEDWNRWTSFFMAPVPKYQPEQLERLEDLRRWLFSISFPALPEELLWAFENFQKVLKALLSLIGEHTEQSGDVFVFRRYRKDYRHNSPEREQGLALDNWIGACHLDLMLELTRAANLIVFRYRRYIDPEFRVGNGELIVTQHCLSEEINHKPIYSEEEQLLPQPFISLQNFLVHRDSRQIHFGSGERPRL